MVPFKSLVSKLRALSPRQLKALAERAEVPVHTVAKIRSGETSNPRILTVEPLMQVVHEFDAPAQPVAAEQ